MGVGGRKRWRERDSRRDGGREVWEEMERDQDREVGREMKRQRDHVDGPGGVTMRTHME